MSSLQGLQLRAREERRGGFGERCSVWAEDGSMASAEARVDAILAEAKKAGGNIAKPAQRAQWGGYFGYFSDPEGYLWKVVAADGKVPFAAE